jgi:cell division GTPase FtsZ
VNILLLSSGGGGGNILRSLKTMFRRDLIVTQKSDPKYAERLRRAVTTRFLDTNEFSLLDVPKEEQLLIGAATTRRLGSMHNPEVAGAALEESRHDVESLLSRFSVIVLIATGGKGTGAGTVFPLAQMAREQRKLVIPIFVQPSFERHEVEKRRYDHALAVAEQFDAARIRLVEILNDRGYVEADPQPQSVVWERMNRPIARGLRGLLYVLSDLSQVDPSDLSVMFAGNGRLRIGFSEITPAVGQDPSDEQVENAVRDCWDNSYCAFGEHVGTSLICVQGDWSNVVDSKIKGRFAALAHSDAGNAAYNPLYARALQVPRPWGVTAILAEYTGTHPPLEIGWQADRRMLPLVSLSTGESPAVAAAAAQPPEVVPSPQIVPLAPAAAQSAITGETPEEKTPADTGRPFVSFWEFALALNRSDPAAVALASDGAECSMPLDVADIRKLLGTFWVRSLFPRLSTHWQDRMLETLLQNVAIPDHALTHGRQTAHVSEITHEELKEIVTETIFPVAIRRDLQLLVAVGTLWGSETMRRFEFTPVSSGVQKPSRLGSLLDVFRSPSTSAAHSEHRPES